MADALDLLHAEWRKQPDADRTAGLCAALVATPRPAIAREVGVYASNAFVNDAVVLLAVGKMYISVGMFSEAQMTLVTAGKANPREPQTYYWLGQALLRRGDAERAEKVFDRALQLGLKDAEARVWLDRAKTFKSVQAQRGMQAVEQEVARALSAAAPSMNLDETVERAASPYHLSPPTMDDVTVETTMAALEEVVAGRRAAAAQAAAAAPIRPAASPAAKPAAAPVAAAPPASVPIAPLAAPFMAPAAAKSAVAASSNPFAPFDAPFGAGPSPFTAAVAAEPTVQTYEPPLFADVNDVMDVTDMTNPGTPPLMGDLPVTEAPPAIDTGDAAIAAIAPFAAIPAPAPSAHASRRLPNVAAVPHSSLNAAAFNFDGVDRGRVPPVRDVLDALAAAGIFERETAALGAGAWAAPDREARRKKPLVLLGIASGLTVIGLFASLYIVRMQRQKAFIEAGTILAGVETDLALAKVSSLTADEKQIGTAFEKDSRSPRAALDWLRERAVAGLLLGGSEISFEDAIGRAQAVGVGEDHIAFARVASSILSGDTSAAIALLPKLDAAARTDAYFELLAGAALDRAGDARAQERFLAAQTLDPSMFLADLLLVRASVLGVATDRAQAQQQVAAFRAKYKDRAESAAIVALAWARDPAQRGTAEPPEVAETVARAAELPLPLASVAPALVALKAMANHDAAAAHEAIVESLTKADGPAITAWLGELALDMDDAKLAQRAALVALSFSAVYPPARMLAAQVELAGDRLDSAAQAVGELEPTFPAVAVVRAAVAYERLDADGLSRAFAALSPDAQKSLELTGLRSASDAMTGHLALGHDQLMALASDPSTWSDRIAFDAALDRGDLDSAQAVAATLRADDMQPLTQLRRARLARYLGHLDDADTLSAAALAGAPGPRTIAERVFTLVAKNNDADAATLLARAAASPLTTWLSAYVAASSGHLDDARARTASLDPPPDLAPLLVRTAAVMALAATKDTKRGKPLAASLLASGDANPDVTAAASSLGITIKTKK